MSDQRHNTPGPWAIIEGMGVYGSDKTEVVARNFPLAHGRGDGRSAANSRLMLAAPDLMDALEQQLAQLQLIANLADDDAAVMTTIEASMKMIGNAIKKARGEA